MLFRVKCFLNWPQILTEFLTTKFAFNSCVLIFNGRGAVKNEIGETGSVASNSILAQIGSSLSEKVGFSNAHKYLSLFRHSKSRSAMKSQSHSELLERACGELIWEKVALWELLAIVCAAR